MATIMVVGVDDDSVTTDTAGRDMGEAAGVLAL